MVVVAVIAETMVVVAVIAEVVVAVVGWEHDESPVHQRGGGHSRDSHAPCGRACHNEST